MKLGEILKIKPGTLIKGIRMTGEPVENRKMYLDLNAWSINGKTVVDFDKTREDPTMRIAALTLVPDRAMVMDGIQEVKKISDITATAMAVNTHLLRDVFIDRSDFGWICEGDIVGMSLGETMVGFVPIGPDIYKKDWCELVCWHRVLIGQKVSWIMMASHSSFHAISDEHLQKKAPDALMEIV